MVVVVGDVLEVREARVGRRQMAQAGEGGSAVMMSKVLDGKTASWKMTSLEWFILQVTSSWR